MTDINFPTDLNTNLLMLFRWLHFVGGITWLGLLYFFNLVNVPFMKGLDPATKGKVLPSLMSRALWWFRWGSVLTVLVGLGVLGQNRRCPTPETAARLPVFRWGPSLRSGPSLGR